MYFIHDFSVPLNNWQLHLVLKIPVMAAPLRSCDQNLGFWQPTWAYECTSILALPPAYLPPTLCSSLLFTTPAAAPSWLSSSFCCWPRIQALGKDTAWDVYSKQGRAALPKEACWTQPARRQWDGIVMYSTLHHRVRQNRWWWYSRWRWILCESC